MKRTEEENMQRKAITVEKLRDAAAYLAGAGLHLTPEQMAAVNQRMGASLAELQANEPTEALGLLVSASLLQTVGEVLGILAPADPVAWTLELLVIGAECVRVLMLSGGYATPTPTQLKQLTSALRRRAESLVSQGMALDPERAREDMREAGARVVLVVLGEPPSRQAIN